MLIGKHIEASYSLPDFMVRDYLKDMSEDDLMVRPIPVVNHFKWQFGHLVISENFHINALGLQPMPALPDGFEETFSTDNAKIDDATHFPTKEEIFKVMQAQREGTLEILRSLNDEQLGQAAPDEIQFLGPTVGSIFAGDVTHWMMHLGQLVVIRKLLSKPTY